jgi:hypothetical protein
LTVNFRSIYAMYRILSQLTHTSLLGMIATVQRESDHMISIATRLPDYLTALLLHAGGASAFNVSQYTGHTMFDNPDELALWKLEGFNLASHLAETVGPLHGLATY